MSFDDAYHSDDAYDIEQPPAASEATRLLSSADDEDDDNEGRWDEAVCVGVGWMSLSALCTLLGGYSLQSGRLASFAWLASASAVFTFFSACSFMGWRKGWQAMWEPKRRSATLLFLLALTFLFISGYAQAPAPVLIVASAAFFAAQLWYSLSYVPYGRETVKGFFNTISRLLRWLG